MSHQAFNRWWALNRFHPKLPREFKQIEDYFVKECLYNYSSKAWNYFNKLSIERLKRDGFENFKQTVSRNYFTWAVSLDHPYAVNLKKLVPNAKMLLQPGELNRKHLFFSQEESTHYNTVTHYFLNYVLNSGWGEELEALEEPLLGNPLYSLYKGKRLSQDILNSLLEYKAVMQNCSSEKISSVVEIGGGYGRTAFCFLTLNPHLKYIMVDVPPALYIAQKYLTEVFPERKAMFFRPFDTFDEVADEFQHAHLVFLTPDQLCHIPDGSIDLLLAINCLHEMKTERVEHYFSEADRLATYFYTKCWQEAYLEADQAHYTQKSYPVRPHWEEIFNQTTEIPSDFFHTLYKTQK